jgi:RNA recognition motif-containing protein
MNIYVSNLSFQVESNDLKDFFTPYGEVVSSKVITDRETGKSRGFGFVEMASDAAGNEAISKLNGAMVDGRALNVTVARPKENTGGGRESFNKKRFF